MPALASPAASPATAHAAFSPTPWSVVLEARRDSTQRRTALENLCTTYWLRFTVTCAAVITRPPMRKISPRLFLLTYSKATCSSAPIALKAGFAVTSSARSSIFSVITSSASTRASAAAERFISIGLGETRKKEFAALDQPQLDPSEAYETTWALTLLARALSRLEEEQTAAGRSRHFVVMKSFLSSTPTRGDYDAAALKLATTRTNVAVWVHRLNQRYAELVKLEVAATVNDPADVKSEMQHLFQAIRR